MRKLIWLPLAGALLIAGAAVTAAAPNVLSTASEVARSAGQHMMAAGSLLQDVLDDLVAEGVINQSQADAITDEVETRVDEKHAEMEQLREQMQQTHERLRTFLEDGVITSDELAQLPEDSPLRNLDSFLDDGQLTTEELQQLGGWGFGGRGPGGHGPGGFGPHGGWWSTDDNSDSESD
jgi:polyhydroxyalkanoate synthesis regulator phasin